MNYYFIIKTFLLSVKVVKLVNAPRTEPGGRMGDQSKKKRGTGMKIKEKKYSLIFFFWNWGWTMATTGPPNSVFGMHHE
jgi:hypothetical protein